MRGGLGQKVRNAGLDRLSLSTCKAQEDVFPADDAKGIWKERTGLVHIRHSQCLLVGKTLTKNNMDKVAEIYSYFPRKSKI